jgi:cation:H+ antiporter
VRVARLPNTEPHLVGPAAAIGALPTRTRRAVVVLLFAGSVTAILFCAEPFAQSLVDTGRHFHVDDFLLISLVAPLASEAPELIVAGMFAWRLQSATGLGALMSSKVNQWTLLVGTLPLVFAISSASRHGLPIDAIQREELFVTAAQSAFAVAILANLQISVTEASTLLGLWLLQLATRLPLFESIHGAARISIGCIYLVLAAIVILRQRAAWRPLMRDGLRAPPSTLSVDTAPFV